MDYESKTASWTTHLNPGRMMCLKLEPARRNCLVLRHVYTTASRGGFATATGAGPRTSLYTIQLRKYVSPPSPTVLPTVLPLNISPIQFGQSLIALFSGLVSGPNYVSPSCPFVRFAPRHHCIVIRVFVLPREIVQVDGDISSQGATTFPPLLPT